MNRQNLLKYNLHLKFKFDRVESTHIVIMIRNLN